MKVFVLWTSLYVVGHQFQDATAFAGLRLPWTTTTTTADEASSTTELPMTMGNYLDSLNSPRKATFNNYLNNLSPHDGEDTGPPMRDEWNPALRQQTSQSQTPQSGGGRTLKSANPDDDNHHNINDTTRTTTGTTIPTSNTVFDAPTVKADWKEVIPKTILQSVQSASNLIDNAKPHYPDYDYNNNYYNNGASSSTSSPSLTTDTTPPTTHTTTNTAPVQDWKAHRSAEKEKDIALAAGATTEDATVSTPYASSSLDTETDTIETTTTTEATTPAATDETDISATPATTDATESWTTPVTNAATEPATVDTDSFTHDITAETDMETTTTPFVEPKDLFPIPLEEREDVERTEAALPMASSIPAPPMEHPPGFGAQEFLHGAGTDVSNFESDLPDPFAVAGFYDDQPPEPTAEPAAAESDWSTRVSHPTDPNAWFRQESKNRAPGATPWWKGKGIAAFGGDDDSSSNDETTTPPPVKAKILSTTTRGTTTAAKMIVTPPTLQAKEEDTVPSPPVIKEAASSAATDATIAISSSSSSSSATSDATTKSDPAAAVADVTSGIEFGAEERAVAPLSSFGAQMQQLKPPIVPEFGAESPDPLAEKPAQLLTSDLEAAEHPTAEPASADDWSARVSHPTDPNAWFKQESKNRAPGATPWWKGKGIASFGGDDSSTSKDQQNSAASTSVPPKESTPVTNVAAAGSATTATPEFGAESPDPMAIQALSASTEFGAQQLDPLSTNVPSTVPVVGSETPVSLTTDDAVAAADAWSERVSHPTDPNAWFKQKSENRAPGATPWWKGRGIASFGGDSSDAPVTTPAVPQPEVAASQPEFGKQELEHPMVGQDPLVNELPSPASVPIAAQQESTPVPYTKATHPTDPNAWFKQESANRAPGATPWWKTNGIASFGGDDSGADAGIANTNVSYGGPTPFGQQGVTGSTEQIPEPQPPLPPTLPKPITADSHNVFSKDNLGNAADLSVKDKEEDEVYAAARRAAFADLADSTKKDDATTLPKIADATQDETPVLEPQSQERYVKTLHPTDPNAWFKKPSENRPSGSTPWWRTNGIASFSGDSEESKIDSFVPDVSAAAEDNVEKEKLTVPTSVTPVGDNATAAVSDLKSAVEKEELSKPTPLTSMADNATTIVSGLDSAVEKLGDDLLDEPDDDFLASLGENATVFAGILDDFEEDDELEMKDGLVLSAIDNSTIADRKVDTETVVEPTKKSEVLSKPQNTTSTLAVDDTSSAKNSAGKKNIPVVTSMKNGTFIAPSSSDKPKPDSVRKDAKGITASDAKESADLSASGKAKTEPVKAKDSKVVVTAKESTDLPASGKAKTEPVKPKDSKVVVAAKESTDLPASGKAKTEPVKAKDSKVVVAAKESTDLPASGKAKTESVKAKDSKVVVAAKESTDLPASGKAKTESVKAKDSKVVVTAKESTDLPASVKAKTEPVKARDSKVVVAAKESTDLPASGKAKTEPVKAKNKVFVASASDSKKEASKNAKPLESSSERPVKDVATDVTALGKKKSTDTPSALDKEIIALEDQIAELDSEISTLSGKTSRVIGKLDDEATIVQTPKSRTADTKNRKTDTSGTPASKPTVMKEFRVRSSADPKEKAGRKTVKLQAKLSSVAAADHPAAGTVAKDSAKAFGLKPKPTPFFAGKKVTKRASGKTIGDAVASKPKPASASTGKTLTKKSSTKKNSKVSEIKSDKNFATLLKVDEPEKPNVGPVDRVDNTTLTSKQQEVIQKIVTVVDKGINSTVAKKSSLTDLADDGLTARARKRKEKKKVKKAVLPKNNKGFSKDPEIVDRLEKLYRSSSAVESEESHEETVVSKAENITVTSTKQSDSVIPVAVPANDTTVAKSMVGALPDLDMDLGDCNSADDLEACVLKQLENIDLMIDDLESQEGTLKADVPLDTMKQTIREIKSDLRPSNQTTTGKSSSSRSGTTIDGVAASLFPKVFSFFERSNSKPSVPAVAAAKKVEPQATSNASRNVALTDDQIEAISNLVIQKFSNIIDEKVEEKLGEHYKKKNASLAP